MHPYELDHIDESLSSPRPTDPAFLRFPSNATLTSTIDEPSRRRRCFPACPSAPEMTRTAGHARKPSTCDAVFTYPLYSLVKEHRGPNRPGRDRAPPVRPPLPLSSRCGPRLTHQINRGSERAAHQCFQAAMIPITPAKITISRRTSQKFVAAPIRRPLIRLPQFGQWNSFSSEPGIAVPFPPPIHPDPHGADRARTGNP